MPNRPKKSKGQPRGKPVDEGLPVEQPAGENFFLANVEIDSPDPCWNDGFDVVGSWENRQQPVCQTVLASSEPECRMPRNRTRNVPLSRLTRPEGHCHPYLPVSV